MNLSSSEWIQNSLPNDCRKNIVFFVRCTWPTSSYFLSASSAINLACASCCSSRDTRSSSILVRFSSALRILAIDYHSTFSTDLVAVERKIIDIWKFLFCDREKTIFQFFNMYRHLNIKLKIIFLFKLWYNFSSIYYL